MDDPTIRLEWCDINNGVEPAPYTALRLVTEWLYQAFQATIHMIQWLEGALYMVLPSGLAWEIIDENFQLNDSWVLPEVKYWAIRFWFGPYIIGGRPLPKVSLSEHFLEAVYQNMNVAVPGSENWQYKDEETGQIYYGYEYSGVRRYHILSDGAKDFGMLALVIAVIYLLIKLDLIHTAIEFMKKALNWYRQRKLRTTIDDIYEAVTKMSNNKTNEDILDELRLIERNIDEIRSRVGLRMILH